MNLPRALLLVGLCVPLAVAFRLDALPPGAAATAWVVQLHGVAKVEDGAVAFVIPSAEPLVGIAMDTQHGQVWLAHGKSLSVHALTGEPLAEIDLPDARQINALGYDRRRDQVWVSADNTLRRFGPNGMQVAP